MDQAVLDTLKLLLEKLMRTALDETNQERSMIEVKKNITIHEAINWAAEVWLEVSSHTIYVSWNRILPSDNQSTEEIMKTDQL